MLGCFSKQKRPSSSLPPPLPPFNEFSSKTHLTNFNSLYDPNPNNIPDPVHSAISSRRLIPAHPGRSNSIVDSAAVSIGFRGTAVAIPTYSPEPYWDFRRSMEEMVVALGGGEDLDLAALRELLLCYLSVNRKQAHKYIFTAFADLLLTLSAADGEC